MTLSNEDREKINKEMRRRKDEQMARTKDAYDKTYKLVNDVKKKNKV